MLVLKFGGRSPASRHCLFTPFLLCCGHDEWWAAGRFFYSYVRNTWESLMSVDIFDYISEQLQKQFGVSRAAYGPN